MCLRFTGAAKMPKNNLIFFNYVINRILIRICRCRCHCHCLHWFCESFYSIKSLFIRGTMHEAKKDNDFSSLHMHTSRCLLKTAENEETAEPNGVRVCAFLISIEIVCTWTLFFFQLMEETCRLLDTHILSLELSLADFNWIGDDHDDTKLTWIDWDRAANRTYHICCEHNPHD